LSVNSKIAAITDKVLFVILCAAVALSPIIYGSTDTIIVLNFEFLSFVALVIFGIKLLLTGESPKFDWLLVPYFVFTLYVLIQFLPIMPGWTPTGIGVDTSMLGQSTSWHTISLDPNSTRASFVKLLSLGSYAFLTINLVNTKQRLNTLVHVIIIVGFLLAVLAIIQDFTWDGKIFWLRETPYRAFGPFVNKDHAAGYFELPFGLGLGLIIGNGVRPDRKLIYGLFTIATGAAIVLSKSRGGVVSLVGAAIIIVILSSLSPRASRSSHSLSARVPDVVKAGLGVALLIVGIFTAAFWINRDSFAYNLGSFGQQETYHHFGSRGVVWRATLDMAKQRPLTGLGFGAYGVSFPRFSQLEGNLSTDYAHNDYLQILSDTGIVGSLIVLGGLAMFWIRAYRNTRTLKGSLGGAHLGAAGAVSAILIHSVFDFNLQIFSTALTFIVLIAVTSAIGIIRSNSDQYDLAS